MQPRKIAFITHSGAPGFLDSDMPVVASLQEEGVEASAIPWDGPEVRWDAFSLLVLRSPWNYHRKFREFNSWLLRLQTQGARLMNPTKVVQWNSDKKYLLELAAMGHNVVPTQLLTKPATALPFDKWREIVVKPSISASSFETYRRTREHSDVESLVARILQHSDVLVQPFIPAITTEGELSLVVLGGQFSHAMRKSPAEGDFRVQKSYGGVCEPCSVPRRVVEFAERLVGELSELHKTPILYARIDGVLSGEEIMIMEVELIEPYLFLEYSSGAQERFARVLLEAIDAFETSSYSTAA